MSWNVAVQQALPSNMSFQIAYVANHGVDLDVSQNVNNPSTYGGGAASQPENVPGYGRTAATNVYFLKYSSNYQSLQTQLSKRFSNGLMFTSAFTWGKGLGYATGGDDNGGLVFFIDQHRNYAPNDYDRTLNFEQSFTYELPFGRGHSHLNSGVAALTLGGWKVAGIISALSGLPFSVYANGNSLNTPGTAQLANLTGPYRVLHGIGSNSPWLDTTAFSQPSGCPALPAPCPSPGVGNTGRNQFRGPGYVQNNISIFKSFPVWREAAAEFRFDAFQLTNSPQFANPNSGSGNIFTAGNFGRVTSTLGSGQGSVNGIGGGRSLQASVKFVF
jgi:hypothetical protein